MMEPGESKTQGVQSRRVEMGGCLFAKAERARNRPCEGEHCGVAFEGFDAVFAIGQSGLSKAERLPEG